MKKYFVLALILGVALFSYGCQQAQQASTTTPSGSGVAASVGDMLMYSTLVDATASGLMGISLSSASPKIELADDLTYTDGWWTFTYADATYGLSYTFKVKAYTSTGAEILNASELNANTNKLAMACTMTLGTNLTFSFGTESNPLIYDGIKTGTKSINGPISISVQDGDGKTYSVSLTYVGIELDSSGYPKSGTAAFSFSSSDYATVAGSITFNGATATLSYSEPAELAGDTYTIDIATGEITIASL